MSDESIFQYDGRPLHRCKDCGGVLVFPWDACSFCTTANAGPQQLDPRLPVNLLDIRKELETYAAAYHNGGPMERADFGQVVNTALMMLGVLENPDHYRVIRNG